MEFGLHNVNPAHRRVAERFEEEARALVGVVDVVLHDDAGVLGSARHAVTREALAPRDQVGAQSQASEIWMYVAVDRDGYEGAVDHIGVGRDGAVGREDSNGLLG